MHVIENDDFYDLVKQYDLDSEEYFVGEVSYYLLSGDKPYEGIKSHREALGFVFDRLYKKSIEDREKARKKWGDIIADQYTPLFYDIEKAQPSKLVPM